jgi:uncharacterized protein (TIGR00290 family)
MAHRRQVLLAWSGGKDAAWTLHVLRQRADVEVVGLLSTISAEDGRASMQGVALAVLRTQARASGLPLLEVDVPGGSGNAVYLERLAEGLSLAAARWPGIDTIAFGDLLLADIRAWREAGMAQLGWRIETPLFGADTAALARAMLQGGLRASLCCVDTQQLDAGFAGRPFDAALLAVLPDTVDPCGENGEFHTCVHNGPMFGTPLSLAPGATWLRDGRFAVTDFVLSAGAGARPDPG